MGQRYIELETSYSINADESVTFHVSQLPPNPAIFPPGPAMIHIVVNGVPSVGKLIMTGSGKIQNQTVDAVSALPANYIPSPPAAPSPTGSPSSNTHHSSGALRNLHASGPWRAIWCAVALVAAAALLTP